MSHNNSDRTEQTDDYGTEISRSVEETAIVEDPEDLQRWFDEVAYLFIEECGFPESVTISITWNRDKEGEDGSE